MVNESQDDKTQQMLDLMLQSHNRDDFLDLYFRLGVSAGIVPERADDRQFARTLLEHMAFTGRKQELINVLETNYKHLNWPDSYIIPSENTISQNRGRRNTKQRVTRKEDRHVKIAHDLYDHVFVHAKIVVWTFLILLLIWTSSLIFFYIKGDEHWRNNFFVFSIFYFFLIFLFYAWVDSKSYKQIEKFTEFYSVQKISERENIKKILQKRNWGNYFWSVSCRFLISVLLKTDKRQANKKRNQYMKWFK